MSDKLKPCPFCGGDDVVCCDQGDDDFAVTCKSCGSSSPFDDVEDIAISAWNTRAALAQPQNAAEADWSDLPKDIYVTSARRVNNVGFDVQCCSVPMAMAPEVRYVRSDTIAAPPSEERTQVSDPSPELAQPQNDAEAVAWRYRYELKEGSWGTWTVQKNKPNWFEPTMTDVQVEPLYTAPPSPELERMREALEQANNENGLLREKLSDELAGGIQHKSDCAVCAAPAYEPSKCDCGAGTMAQKLESLLHNVVRQFRKKGCECTFPSDDCCWYSAAEAFLKSRAGDNHASDRTAPLSCPDCHDESDCSHVDICRAVEEAYASDGKESEGGGQVAPAKCSATGVHPTDTSCTAEPEVAPGPSDPTPAQERREEIARHANEINIIASGGWSDHHDQDFGTKDDEYKLDRIREHARAILASPPPKVEPSIFRRAAEFISEHDIYEESGLSEDELELLRQTPVALPPAPKGEPSQHPTLPDRGAIARLLMNFDGHSTWELDEHDQQVYFKRADRILALRREPEGER